MKEEKIINEFRNLLEEFTYLRGKKSKKFDLIFEDIFQNSHIRKHFLEFAEWEIEHDNLRPKDIAAKYMDELMIRHEIRYQLAKTPIYEINDEEQRKFWKYLCIIQAFLAQSARTEPQHAVRLQSRIFPGKEHKMAQLSDINGELRKKANYFLDQLSPQMNSEDMISGLLEKGEDDELEYKRYWEYNPEKNSKDRNMCRKVLREVCGLANKEGGYLLIGVKDNGDIRGVEEDLQIHETEDELRQNIDNRIKDMFDNQFASEFIDVEILGYKGDKIIFLSVQKVFYDLLELEGETYLREGQSSRKLSEKEIENLREMRRRKF